ncbi:MAG TPA: PfkB family carbohydrate kinase, partial [Anaerovoracaceae bacterium]|nr:PfkB family carbohydrate kinase [Anaerovoracaceae bacterium]
FGSLSLTDSPARETTIFALEEAKKANCIISYDPNYRPLLWKSKEQAKEQMRAVLPYVNIIKLSDEETELVTGHADPQAAAKHLIDTGIKIAAVTLGKDGVLIATKDGCDTVPGFPVDAIDTTGAGDAFWGAFLFSVGELGSVGGFGGIGELDEEFGEINLSKVREIARFANAAAALCVTKRGAIPAMPQLNDIVKLAVEINKSEI